MKLFTQDVDDKYLMYNTKANIPQYTPSAKKPHISSLVDTTKYTQLLREINNSNLPDDEKEFLKLGATRHIKFNYSQIADYYAHASAEMQELIEHSALVIIDFDDAIANGYVKLTKDIRNIMKQSGVGVGEE